MYHQVEGMRPLTEVQIGGVGGAARGRLGSPISSLSEL